MHSVYLNKTSELESFEWLERRTDKYNSKMSALWSELLKHAQSEFPAIWSEQRYVCTARYCL